MRRQIHNVYHKLLVLLHLSPLSLAEKCRITFGGAVVLVLVLALSIPYIWMGQLTKKGFLDAERRKSETLLRRHFQEKEVGQTTLPILDITGATLDVNDTGICWIRFTKDEENKLNRLDESKERWSSC